MSINYRINEFAKRVGRSVQTVRRWEKEGKLIAKRLPSGQRYFDKKQIQDDFVEYKIGVTKDELQ